MEKSLVLISLYLFLLAGINVNCKEKNHRIFAIKDPASNSYILPDGGHIEVKRFINPYYNGPKKQLGDSIEITPNGSVAGLQGYSWHVGNGERETLRLPDSSIVILDPGSNINISYKFKLPNRKVYLSGKAIFEIHDSTGLTMITDVEGVEILAEKGRILVDCFKEDKVIRVSNVNSKVTLKSEKGQLSIPSSACIQLNKFTSKTRNVFCYAESDLDWFSDILNLDGCSLHELFLTIGRWYGMEVEFKGDLNDEIGTGNLHLYVPVQEMLETINRSTHLNTYVIGNKIMVCH